jgi:hypothetical protein
MKEKCVWLNDDFYEGEVAKIKASIRSRHRSNAWKYERIKSMIPWLLICRELRIMESGDDPIISRRFLDVLEKCTPFSSTRNVSDITTFTLPLHSA